MRIEYGTDAGMYRSLHTEPTFGSQTNREPKSRPVLAGQVAFKCLFWGSFMLEARLRL